MTEGSRHLRVFLCHSSGDEQAVSDLYERLREDGFDPWLDKENLLPGQHWHQEITKAVRTVDAVIVCLSRGSINKTGYVQREIKYALDAADERPEGTIFLIPLKLEECEIPERLSHLHCVRLFEERGYERLFTALRQRTGSLLIPSTEAQDSNVENRDVIVHETKPDELTPVAVRGTGDGSEGVPIHIDGRKPRPIARRKLVALVLVGTNLLIYGSWGFITLMSREQSSNSANLELANSINQSAPPPAAEETRGPSSNEAEQQAASDQGAAGNNNQSQAITVILVPAFLREPAGITRAKLQDGTRILRIQLLLSEDGYQSYRAELVTYEGKRKKLLDGLQAQPGPRGKLIVIDLPVETLTRGDNMIRLYGIRVSGQAEEIAVYEFRVSNT